MPRRNGPARLKQQTLFSHFPPSSPPTSPIKRPRKASRGATRRAPAVSSESSNSDGIDMRPPPSKKQAIINDESTIIAIDIDSDSSDVGKIKFEKSSASGASSSASAFNSDDADAPATSSQAMRNQIIDSDISDSGENHSNSPPLRLKRRHRMKQESASSEDETPPKKRKGRLTKREVSVSEDEEEEDLLDGIDENKIIDSQSRAPEKKSKFRVKLDRLDKLKKKRQRIWNDASGSESETNSEDDILPGATPFNGKYEEDEEETQNDIDDFIVEDEDGTGTAGLPAMFSMSSHQDLSHQFKVVCQYFVHLAVTSDRSRKRKADELLEDDYFKVPLAITRRKLSDLRDSIVSSVWKPKYKSSMRKYPILNITMLDFAVPQCDACNLGGRMSKYIGRMDGAPYDRKNFEDFKRADDSEDSDNEEKPRFHLGRFCARRTQIYHELSHWEYHLYHALYHEVGRLQNAERAFVKVSYAGTARMPDDISDADQIMEWLDERNILKAEWTKVKQMMEKATMLEADVKRGVDD